MALKMPLNEESSAKRKGFAKYRENRRAAQHSGFKPEMLAFGFGKRGQFTIAMHNRSFVGSDGMHVQFKCIADMIQSQADPSVC